MKEPSEFTMIGLVTRMLRLKLEEQIIKARRNALRAEIMRRLPDGMLVVAGWRLFKRYVPSYTHISTSKARWRLFVRKNEPGTREESL